MRFVFWIRLGIARGEFRDFGEGFRLVLPHEEMAAVGEGRKKGRVLGNDFVAVAREFELAHHLFLHQAY